ncbi:MAG: hypothetical protein MJZ38_04980 [archaeon]|nr:hypothetical protein [archaeon]
MTETSTLTILLNPPKGFRGRIHFMIGINDEMIGEGYANETIQVTVPAGVNEVSVLVRNEGTNSMQGSTVLDASRDLSLKIKYGLFSKKAELVLN